MICGLKSLPLSAPALAVLVLALAGCGGGGDGGDGDGGGQTQAAEQVLRVNLGSEPPSLDPGLATDVTSSNVLGALMDPLVKLGEDLEPVPSLAESWEISEDGKTVIFTLRQDGKWTNGDPVTAHDFEYSWKRTLSPELGADYAYQFYGIVGAAEYNGCTESCDKLRDAVGAKAVDDYTFEVVLTTPQPWFIQQMAHHSFMAVHRETVEQHKERWTEPANIVTNGPFRLTRWDHEASLTLERWADWRDAGSVELERVEGVMIQDATTTLQSFEAGEIDGCIDAATCIPPAEIERLKESPVYKQHPALVLQYIGVNVGNIPDLNQRRALAFAIDRQTIVENVTKAGEVPATGFVPEGMPGFDVINQDFLPTTADLDQAREFLAQAENPKMQLNYFANNDETNSDLAVAVQDMWAPLGIKTTIKAMEWAQFLEFLGPPPNKAVDVFALGWVGDYVDAINFLELALCDSGNNLTQFCDAEFDRTLGQARATFEDEPRHELYGQAEARITGSEGLLPYIPLYWGTYPILTKENVQGWEPNLLDQFDFTKVSITE
jgi:oligopeptide transport system substrate-binding protein